MRNRIDVTLSASRAVGKPVLVPFVTVGFPSVEMSQSLAETVLESGADMLELGIPFSDPLADGPTIQMTSYAALKNNVNIETVITVLGNLRTSQPTVPLIVMGYYNPFLRYGVERFLDCAAAAGLDGIIVPDLPLEESAEFRQQCYDRRIHLVPLLAPTSPTHRIKKACAVAGGFIYCVSLTGVTGARRDLSADVERLVLEIRTFTDLPVLVGFGVSTRKHVEFIGEFADGAVVASALLDAVNRANDNDKLETAERFVRELIERPREL